jgi:hypothetical protein
MRVSILVRSYWKDLEWLQFCLRGIERYCRGFAEVVVAMPESSRPWMVRYKFSPVARFVFGPNYADDYLGQQVTKLHADVILDADWIVHVDADCIFRRVTRPEDLAVDGRPRIPTRPIADLGRHYPWRRATEEFLGGSVELDFMQRPPFVYPRWLYAELRRYCLETHGVTLTHYVIARPPRGFSEFNALGAYAHRRAPEAFEFPDIDDARLPPPVCDWHWSWGGIDHSVRQRIEATLAGDIE